MHTKELDTSSYNLIHVMLSKWNKLNDNRSFEEKICTDKSLCQNL